MIIGVCDDNPVHLQDAVRLIRSLCTQLGYSTTTVLEYQDPIALLSELKQTTIHILLLDMHLHDINGVDIAQEVNRLCPNCQIIFLTGYIEMAPIAYDAEHIYLVLKPEMEQRMPLALEKAIKNINKQVQTVSIKYGLQQDVIRIRNILYFERVKRKTRVVCNNNREYWTYQSPEELIKGCTPAFIQCHCSYYVNPIWIERLQSKTFLLKNTLTIPISRSFLFSAKEAFWAFMSRRSDI